MRRQDHGSGTRHTRGWFASALLMGVMSNAVAGPGFIESARVSSGSPDDNSAASIEVRFNCKAEFLRHEPQGSSDRLRVYLDPTGICNGVSPVVAQSRSRLRPANSDSANLIDLEYDGDSPAGPTLTLNFSQPVNASVEMSGVSFGLVVSIGAVSDQPARTPSVSPSVDHRQVPRPEQRTPTYVVNLVSLQRIPTIADAGGLDLAPGQRLYYSEVAVDGEPWFRLRLGNFASGDAAAVALGDVKSSFPGAWIAEIDEDADVVEIRITEQAIVKNPIDMPEGDGTSGSKVDVLMEDARKSMAAGEISRAIQIYTKVLQQPEHPRLAEAQEYLALAREKNGQTAHAKAEYQRYLSLYPDSEGAARVNQRLSALLAGDRQVGRIATAAGAQAGSRISRQSDWRVLTYFSQYYRRDVNQQSDQNEIVSQSAIYSDVNLDARRRGERFDFSSRLSAGYRNDFLDERTGSGDELRISYAYADIADATTGLRGRIGRQSRNNGGVLGRFDGLNLGYQLGERVLLNTVVGKPAYSSSDGIDSSRSFYGASVNYGPILENLDLGMFYIEQDVEGIQDRQAVGGEFRYFGLNQSFWGMVDYDLAYGELASAFLQGSWRFESRLSIHGLIDRRGSPFLSASNALIGQPVATFQELAQIYSEDELRQLGRDRTASSTTFTIGLSYPLSPRLQINADASQSTLDATPASGGVFGTEESTYNYYSTSLVASSIFKEGDVSIVSARYSDSDTSRVISFTFDSRYPVGRSWRINPRLRVDRRERISDPNYEWLYTPGIRIQYRRSQKFRIDLEAGKQFVQRDTDIVDLNLDRESYYINLGYQSFF
ncbi:MAG: SPOR domain-containing protein [Woeseiaceae bacterium]